MALTTKQNRATCVNTWPHVLFCIQHSKASPKCTPRERLAGAPERLAGAPGMARRGSRASPCLGGCLPPAQCVLQQCQTARLPSTSMFLMLIPQSPRLGLAHTDPAFPHTSLATSPGLMQESGVRPSPPPFSAMSALNFLFLLMIGRKDADPRTQVPQEEKTNLKETADPERD